MGLINLEKELGGKGGRLRGEKKFKDALNCSQLRWLISFEAPGTSGSFTTRSPFHLKLDGDAQLKAYQFVSKSTPIKVVTSNKTIIIATRLPY